MRKCLVLLVAMLLVVIATAASTTTRNAPARGAPTVTTQGIADFSAAEPTAALAASNDTSTITAAGETAHQKSIAQLFVRAQTEVTTEERTQEECATPPLLIGKTGNVRPAMTGRVALNPSSATSSMYRENLVNRREPEVVDLRRQHLPDQNTKA